MSEVTGGDSPSSESQSNIEVPVEIDDATMAELMGESPTQQAAPEQPEGESVAEQPVQPEEPIQEPEVSQGAQITPELLEQMQTRTAQAVAHAMQQGQTQGQAQETVLDVLIKNNPEVPRESLEWMVKATETISQNQFNEYTERLNRIERALSHQANDNITKQYESHLNSLADQLGIESDFDRQSMAALVTKRGLEQYGQKFDMEKASRLYKHIDHERRQASHSKQQAYVDKRTTEAAEEPPVKGSTSTATATEDILKGLKDPKDRSFNPTGRNFQKVLKNFIRHSENAALG